MQGTQPTFLRLMIHIVLLVVLLLMLPDRPNSPANNLITEYPENETASQNIGAHKASTASGFATTSLSNHTEANIKPTSGKTIDIF